ncbi:MAG: hypothetical protein WA160_14115 [Pseudobdellovibrio sp.]
MNLKIFAILFSIFMFQNSEAQLRCFDLFMPIQNSSLHFAKRIDELNATSNNKLFNAELSQALKPDLADKQFSEQLKLRYRAFNLNRLLKKLKTAENWDRYEFENFAKKLEKLSYLTNSEVIKNLSKSDYIIYQQARHSLLADGLEGYFFNDANLSTSLQLKIFDLIMMPFKDIYFRWTYSLFSMPKMNGAILPPDIAAEVLWKGVNNTRDLVAPYLVQTNGKHYFNVFSSAYNWALISALFLGAPTYGYLTYTDLEAKGQTQAIALFTPMLKQSQEAANQDYHVLAKEKESKYFIQEFRLLKNRDPNPQELEIIKRLSHSSK